MENKINAKFDLTITNSENYVPDLHQFDIDLNARISDARTIRIRILNLSKRRQERVAKPSTEEVLSPNQALIQAQFRTFFRTIDIMTKDEVETIPITVFYPNINAFMPHIIEFARQSADTAVEGHEISGDNWRTLVSACESHEQLPFTFADAFDIIAILRWCEDQKDYENLRIDLVSVSDLAAVVEGEYLAKLESILQSIEVASEKTDLHAIIEAILQVRTNLVLDANVFSCEYISRIGEAVSQINAYKNEHDIKIWDIYEVHRRGVIDAVLTENWRLADNTIAAIDRLVSIPHLSAAFDVEWCLFLLKAWRKVAFAAYLFVGNDITNAVAGGDDKSLPNLRKLLNALQTENLPIRDVSSLISVYQTNDLKQFLQLTGRTTGKDVLLDAIKITDFIAPYGINGEYLAREENVSFLFEELSDPDSIHSAKLISNWFLPPLLLGVLTDQDERWWQPFVDSLSITKSLSYWKKYDGAFCGVFSRAVDLAYPNHPPFLVGHVLNIYPEIVEHYQSVPADTDEMIKVLKALFGPNGERFQSRLQKSRLHVLAEASVGKIASDDAKKFLRRCYEQAGFIVTDEFCDQLAVTIGEHRKGLINDGSNDMKVLRKKRMSEFSWLGTEGWSKSMKTDFDKDYRRLVTYPEWEIGRDKQPSIRQSIDHRVDGIWKRIQSSETKRLEETLASAIDHNAIPSCPEIVRTLIGRRLVLKCAFEIQGKKRSAVTLGYSVLKNLEPDTAQRKSNNQNFKNKLEDWVIDDLVFELPKKYAGFTPDEVVYFGLPENTPTRPGCRPSE